MIADDERAVSTAITHAMAVGVTALLITGLLIGSSQMIEDQQRTVTERGLRDVGSAIVTEIVRLDQFNTTETNVSIRSENPEQVAGSGYDVQLLEKPSGPAVLYVNSSDPSLDIEVPVRFETDTAICESRADGGPVIVRYRGHPSLDCIEVTNP